MNATMGRRRVIWRTPEVSADGLKMFACITMMVQTIGITVIEKGLIHLDRYTQAELSQAMAEDSHLMVLAGVGSVMQLVGGLALPIFAFLLVEGFRQTSDYRRYLLTMAAFALLSEVPFDLANSLRPLDWSGQNALVTMCVCLLMLYFLKMVQDKMAQDKMAQDKKWFLRFAAQFVIVLCSVVWVALLRAQYGFCMVLLVAVFYVFYAKNALKIILGILISLLYVTGPLAFYGIGCYNGQRKDKVPKYMYYMLYPLHLLVFGIFAKCL